MFTGISRTSSCKLEPGQRASVKNFINRKKKKEEKGITGEGCVNSQKKIRRWSGFRGLRPTFFL